jgi:hypothetical protein
VRESECAREGEGEGGGARTLTLTLRDISVMPWRDVGVDMCDLLHYFLSGRLYYSRHSTLCSYSQLC